LFLFFFGTNGWFSYLLFVRVYIMVNKFRRYLMNISEVWWNRACLDFEIQQNSVDLAEKLAQNLDLMEPDFSSRLNLCQLHLHKLSLVSTTPRFRMTDGGMAGFIGAGEGEADEGGGDWERKSRHSMNIVIQAGVSQPR
jgi:hypothetical protein